MRVGGIVVDPNTQSPIVVLRGVDEPRLYLPIFIGGMEATAIATALAEMELPRPMTHDLMAGMLRELSVSVDRVVVTDLIEGTFYAEITLADSAGHAFVLDARPSDSIALAVRTGAGVWVARRVLEEAGGMSEESADGPEETSTGGDPAPEAAFEGAGAEEGAAGDPEPAEPARPSRKEEPSGPMPVFGSDVRLEDLDPDLFGKYKM